VDKKKGKRQKREKARREAKARQKWVLGPPEYQQIWMDALRDLRNQLCDHCLTAKEDQLRFQHGRLFANLTARLDRVRPRHLFETMAWCYQLVTDCREQLGYDEPQRMHLEEMAALRAIPAAQEDEGKKCRQAENYELLALLFGLESIASWIEAQEAFNTWVAFNHNRKAWRSKDREERMLALEAGTIARLPDFALEKEIAGRYKEFHLSIWLGAKWNKSQWIRILEQAARLREKTENAFTALEYWVWWCYPVFHRWGWNAREVREAAVQRGFREAEEMAEEKFRRYWMTRGLRLGGKRTSRNSPPLAEFVRHVSLPDSNNVLGLPIWGPVIWLRKKTENP
jgi:hypothetical protein